MALEKQLARTEFCNEIHKATANILYTASWLESMQNSILKNINLTFQQFAILNSLMERQGKPTTVKLLTKRMIDKTSNTSRLVEKMREKGLVERSPNKNDRRKVDIFITQEGEEVHREASSQLEELVNRIYDNLDDTEINKMNLLLDRLRDKE